MILGATDGDRPGDNAFSGTIDLVRIDIGDDSHDHLIDPQHAMRVAMLRH